MAYVNDIRSAAPSFEGFGFVKTLAERFARYRVYRDTVAELSMLSGRELSDLGLTRGEIRATAYEAAYGA